MWEYKHDLETDETVIYWGDEEQARISGEITRWKNGCPATDSAREAVGDAIQNAGTPDRIRMQYDFSFGFTERDSEQQ